jgi:hypothetical protein
MTRIVQEAPDTRFRMPFTHELDKLYEIVRAAHPELDGFDVAEFGRGLWAAGQFWRTDEPCRTRYFGAWVDNANEKLVEGNAASISAPAFLAGIIGSADIVWQRQDHRIGAMLEIGLDRYRGRPCSTPNAWRGVVHEGKPLLAPVDPPWIQTGRIDVPQVKISQLDVRTGRMREVQENQSLWRQS